MMDCDSSTIVAWCQEGGMGALSTPAAILAHPPLCLLQLKLYFLLGSFFFTHILETPVDA